MFGHLKKKASYGKQPSAIDKDKEAMDLQNQQVADKTAQSKLDRQTAREEGRADTEAFLQKDVQGLDPQKRKALQYEANKAIQRSHQSTNRKLLGDQSMKGIQGQGGVGYAQQRDLQNMALDAERGVTRDLDKLDSDLALKMKAAIFAGGEGNAAMSQLDKQAALDELLLGEEKKRHRQLEDQFYKQFSRI